MGAEPQPSDPAAADDDFSAAQTTLKLKAAAALLGVAGVLTAVMGLQLVLVTFIEAWLNIVSYAWLALGAALIYMAAMVLRARTWAAVGGMTLAAFTALAGAGWGIYAMAGGIFSCIQVLVVPAAIAACAVAGIGIPDARRASAARARMADAGMDIGM